MSLDEAGPEPAAALDPESVRALSARYHEWLRVHHYSASTLESFTAIRRWFVEWCEGLGVERAEEVTRPLLEHYRRYLYYYRQGNGEPLALSTQCHRLSWVRGFFRWLMRQELLPHNPASELELPRRQKLLPKKVLTAAEVEQVMAQPDLSTPLGLRDRAMLEALYATGLRRSELLGLDVGDLDAARKTAIVRRPKNKVERVVPIGSRALGWLARYLDDGRPHLLVGHDDGALFLGRYGRRIGKNQLSHVVGRAIRGAGIGRTRGSCHLLRHTVATLMLENGADIRYIQQMLGHLKLTSTQIYTSVSIKKLQEVYDQTHPAERRRRRGPEEQLPS